LSFQQLMHHGECARPRTSDLLRAVAEAPGETLRFADLLAVLGDRAFGALLLVFALPNCLPVPALPGLSTLMALPLVLLSAQLALGRRQPGLPRWLGERRLRRADLARMVERLTLLWLERVLRPRWPGLSSARAERWLGLVCLLLSVMLALPIPMANLLTGWSVLIIAIGLVEDDGLLIGVGLVVAVLALAMAVAVSLAWLEGAEWVWRLWAAPD
jgi:hypothetical protein